LPDGASEIFLRKGLDNFRVRQLICPSTGKSVWTGTEVDDHHVGDLNPRRRDRTPAQSIRRAICRREQKISEPPKSLKGGRHGGSSQLAASRVYALLGTLQEPLAFYMMAKTENSQ
jgi:hypothetical protein